MAISGAIGTNLLAMQGPARNAAGAKVEPWHMQSLVDSDNLGRKALEALIGSHISREMPPPKRTPQPVRAPTEGKRVGSFAPSSGSFSQVALPGGDPEQVRKGTVKGVQSELHRRGYEPGTFDGVAGLVTRAAVMAYEHDQGLPITAEPSPEVLAHLRHGTSAPGAAIGLEPNAPRSTGEAEQVIRAVQQALAQLGYLASRPNGFASDETVRAIREYEMDSGLVPTGRISAPLVSRLARHAGGQRTQ